MKTFEDWEYEELELTFGIERLKSSPVLEQWLAAKCEIAPFEKSQLALLQKRIAEKGDSWNEDELKFFFIGHIVSMVDFMGEKFGSFTQRTISAKKMDVNGNEIELKGRVEFMVSMGKQHPRQPFFCLHEYKPEKRRDADPLGQLLSAMLASKELNTGKHPIYGCYVIGRLWFFVVLEAGGYAVSEAFVATSKDLFDIYCVLQECKKYVQRLAA